MKTAYFILGMHRSGTSALAGTLFQFGLDFGSQLTKAIANENPKGFFENIFVQELNKKIMAESGYTWDSYHFNYDKVPHNKIHKYIKEAKKIIKKEYRYSDNFVVKDPRICLLFPIWEQACNELKIKIKIILPFRNPLEVALSLKKRNNFSIEKGLILWSHHFLAAEYFSRSYERFFISFDELLEDTKNVVDELYEFTALKGRKKRKDVDEFLDSSIKHNNILMENFTKETPKYLQRILVLLRESKFDDLNVIDSIRNDFYYSLEMFQHDEILEDIAAKKIQAILIEEQNKKIEELSHYVKLLEPIRDIATIDEAYYLKKYSDLKKYSGSLSEHYYKYGKKEGRNPNAYCEYYNIDTRKEFAKDEILYGRDRLVKVLETKDEELVNKEKKISLLEQIKDVAVVDEEYYLKRYPNLRKYKGKLAEHYFRYGKKEGRNPNKYCEYYKINTKEEVANDEIIYNNELALESQLAIGEKLKVKKESLEELVKQNELALKNKSNDLAVLGREIGEEKEKTAILNKNKRALEDKLRKLESNNSNQKLKIEKQQVEIENQEKLIEENIATLENEKIVFEDKLRKLESNNSNQKLKIEKQQVEIENQEKLIEENIATLENEKIVFEDKLRKLESNNSRQKLKVEKQQVEIEKQRKLIEKLQDEQRNLEKLLEKRELSINKKSKEIDLLNINVDNMVEDFIRVKERKSWIMENMQKVLKG